MTRRFLLLAPALCALAACASPASTAGQPSPTTSATTAFSTPAPTTSVPPQPVSRRIGDTAEIGCTGSSAQRSCTMQFTITKVTKCVGRGYPGEAPPEGTQRRLLWVEVRTGGDYRVNELSSGLFTQFQSISRRDVTSGDINPSSSWECSPKKDRIGFGDEDWLPHKTYAGAIEVYLPDDAAKVVNAEGLWEWEL